MKFITTDAQILSDKMSKLQLFYNIINIAEKNINIGTLPL